MEANTEKQNNQIMKIEEIIEFINKLGYKIDKSNLESNDSDLVIELYSSIFEKIGLLKKDKLKIKFDGMENFSYTGLHDRPIYVMKLFNTIKNFVIDVLGLDFSTSDLFTPNFKRTKRILSGLIRFFKYKQNEKDTYDTMKENLDNSISLIKESQTKVDKTKSNYNKLKEKKENEKSQVDEYLSKMSVLSVTKEEVDKNINELEEKCKTKANEIEENYEKMKNIDFLNESNSLKITTLKSQIVHSPEKLQNVLEELKINNETLSSQISDLENNQKNFEKHSKILESLIKYLNEYETLGEDLEKVSVKVTNINEVVYCDKEDKSRKEKILTEIQSNIDNIEKTLFNLGDYVNEFHSKQRKALEAKDESLNQMKEKFSIYQKRIAELSEMIRLQNLTNKALEDNVLNIFYFRLWK